MTDTINHGNSRYVLDNTKIAQMIEVLRDFYSLTDYEFLYREYIPEWDDIAPKSVSTQNDFNPRAQMENNLIIHPYDNVHIYFSVNQREKRCEFFVRPVSQT